MSLRRSDGVTGFVIGSELMIDCCVACGTDASFTLPVQKEKASSRREVDDDMDDQSDGSDMMMVCQLPFTALPCLKTS